MARLLVLFMLVVLTLVTPVTTKQRMVVEHTARAIELVAEGQYPEARVEMKLARLSAMKGGDSRLVRAK